MIGSDWGVHAFRLHPLEPNTGPFPELPFLQATWRHHERPSDELLIASSDIGVLPLVVRDGLVEILGHEDVTDYHSPLGAGLPALLDEVAGAVESGTRFSFDSLPGRAASGLNDALLDLGFIPYAEPHEVAAVLHLPESFDDYLMMIGKKERHETRRKRRRYEAELGEPRIVRRKGVDAVAAFAEMHRSSSGDKGEFMSAEMEEFFSTLHLDVGAVIDVLVTADDRAAAASFAFEDDDTYYLYNSAFEPEFSHSSPGVVMLSMLIETAIEAGRTRFDFLKGDETYKFRLGAQERPLCRLTGTFDR